MSKIMIFLSWVFGAMMIISGWNDIALMRVSAVVFLITTGLFEIFSELYRVKFASGRNHDE